ncbi:transcription factor bHLH30-like [Cynara cardunculus var. scolymus]|uniref:Myc-type, basic helix-loop-helix (BHLH) domain-containing protein n=1 Tax=Cynara cardunculus var. scolymus TaxID=59895 RepID=A0A118JY07_CYNCS|nr:transcription factor bHLH30-like [Cynara cardunculus var. scolymus]KVH96310.1 Myc-type, basic helix-loop-helix (bHLH) domain-containing protein [Cynara cardunculus var. scolymus]
MCSKREEQEPVEDQEQELAGDHHHQDFQRFQEHSSSIVQQIQHQNMGINDYSYTSSSEVSPILHPQQQPWMLPQVFHHHNTGYNTSDLHFPGGDHGTYLFPPPPPPPSSLSSYGGLVNRRVPGGGLQFAYEGSTSSSDHHLRLISETLGQMVQPGSMPFGLQAEMGKMTAQEIMDAKALAASKSHSEAERRRRERINNHLAKLRSLLPSTTKTDKASLLAEVIQHVKELKRQTSIIAEQSPVPTETDELIIDNTSDEDGNLVIRASLCCEDRTDLLPDLIKTLKALRLRTLKAEITTLGGRVKNVLFITGDQDANSNNDTTNYSISMIQEAFKAVMEKTNGEHESSSGSVKRQRTNNINVLDHRRT